MENAIFLTNPQSKHAKQERKRLTLYPWTGAQSLAKLQQDWMKLDNIHSTPEVLGDGGRTGERRDASGMGWEDDMWDQFNQALWHFNSFGRRYVGPINAAL